MCVCPGAPIGGTMLQKKSNLLQYCISLHVYSILAVYL